MFAIRESVQDSLGYSPAELVFGHTVRGPLKLLSEQLLATKPTARSVSEYVDTFRKRLKHVRNLARENLTAAQAVMKAQYDRRAIERSFKPGDWCWLYYLFLAQHCGIDSLGRTSWRGS